MIERPVYLGNAVQLLIRLANGDRIQALIQNAGRGDPLPPGRRRQGVHAGRRAAGAHRHGRRADRRGRGRASRLSDVTASFAGGRG